MLEFPKKRHLRSLLRRLRKQKTIRRFDVRKYTWGHALHNEHDRGSNTPLHSLRIIEKGATKGMYVRCYGIIWPTPSPGDEVIFGYTEIGPQVFRFVVVDSHSDPPDMIEGWCQHIGALSQCGDRPITEGICDSAFNCLRERPPEPDAADESNSPYLPKWQHGWRNVIVRICERGDRIPKMPRWFEYVWYACMVYIGIQILLWISL